MTPVVDWARGTSFAKRIRRGGCVSTPTRQDPWIYFRRASAEPTPNSTDSVRCAWPHPDLLNVVRDP